MRRGQDVPGRIRGTGHIAQAVVRDPGRLRSAPQSCAVQRGDSTSWGERRRGAGATQIVEVDAKLIAWHKPANRAGRMHEPRTLARLHMETDEVCVRISG
jgi:hypothetical protein